MKYLAIFIIFIFATDSSLSQEIVHKTAFDSTEHKRIYRISKSDYQHIELVENLDGVFSGQLINVIWKVNRKDQRTKAIEQTLDLTSSQVKNIMDIAFVNNIEILPNCEDVDGCVIGLDGTSISFKVITTEVNRDFWYWEPENDYYQDPSISEIISVRTILNAVSEQINLNSLYSSFTSDLPKGNYAFGGLRMKKN
jgi:hypothetical protein